jgi:hypothetical protein
MLIRQFMVHPYIQHSHKNITEDTEAHVFFFRLHPSFPLAYIGRLYLLHRENKDKERGNKNTMIA